MYLKRTIEPLETEDVGDNVANDSTAGDSKDTQIQETKNDGESTGADTDIQQNDTENSNDIQQKETNNTAKTTELDSNSEETGTKGVTKVNNAKAQESCAGIL